MLCFYYYFLSITIKFKKISIALFKKKAYILDIYTQHFHITILKKNYFRISANLFQVSTNALIYFQILCAALCRYRFIEKQKKQVCRKELSMKHHKPNSKAVVQTNLDFDRLLTLDERCVRLSFCTHYINNTLLEVILHFFP